MQRHRSWKKCHLLNEVACWLIWDRSRANRTALPMRSRGVWGSNRLSSCLRKLRNISDRVHDYNLSTTHLWLTMDTFLHSRWRPVVERTKVREQFQAAVWAFKNLWRHYQIVSLSTLRWRHECNKLTRIAWKKRRSDSKRSEHSINHWRRSRWWTTLSSMKGYGRRRSMTSDRRGKLRFLQNASVRKNCRLSSLSGPAKLMLWKAWDSLAKFSESRRRS